MSSRLSLWHSVANVLETLFWRQGFLKMFSKCILKTFEESVDKAAFQVENDVEFTCFIFRISETYFLIRFWERLFLARIYLLHKRFPNLSRYTALWKSYKKTFPRPRLPNVGQRARNVYRWCIFVHCKTKVNVIKTSFP